MKNLLIFLTAILLMACVLFWRQVWGIFAGMSVLEAMNTIVTFLLHVAVATIAAYAVMLIPEYVLPWLKAFGGRQKPDFRRQRVEARTQKSDGISRKDLMQLLERMTNPTPRPPQIKKKNRFGEGASDEPIIRLDL